MKIAKRQIGIFLFVAILIGIGAVGYSFWVTINNAWNSAATWAMSENIHIPKYDPQQIKITQTHDDKTGKADLEVDYCLLLNSVNEEQKITLRCSLIPYAYSVAQLHDPYAWKPETGISLTLEKASFVTPTAFLGKESRTFEDIAVAGQYYPVSIRVSYTYKSAEATLSNKIKHYFATKNGNPEEVKQSYVSWQVNRVKEFSELSQTEKTAFKDEWAKAALSEMESVYNVDSLKGKDGQSLLDTFMLLIRNELFVCTTESSATHCRLSGEANPAEASMYLNYVEHTDFGKKLAAEMVKRLDPFAPKTSPDVYTCGDKGPRDDCTKWSSLQSYQLPMCPVRNVADKITDTNEAFFLKARVNLDPHATITKNEVEKFYAAYLKHPVLEDPEHLHLLESVDALCKNIITGKVTDKESVEALTKYYYTIAFRNAQVWNTERGKDMLTPNKDNLLELLYISYKYSPYKYHLLQDGKVILSASTAGYTNERIETSLGYAYNLYASLVALYLLR